MPLFPPLPEPHALAMMALTLIALGLFMRESIPLETSSLFVLALITVGFELFPYEVNGRSLHAVDFFHGFGHDALVAVCALMIVGHGLVRTGALEPVGRGLATIWAVSPHFSLLLTLVVAAGLSAFVNNTPIVILLLPILISVALRTTTPTSSVLMPVGIATLIGGTATTIGTSTNLLVVAVAADMGLPRIEMFDFFVPAAIVGGIGIVYLWLVAPRITPVRLAPLADISPRLFTAQLHLPEGSFADGKTLTEVRKKTSGQIRVNRIQRGRDTFIVPLPDALLKAGDQLLVVDTPAQLKEFERLLGAKLYSGETVVDEEHPLTAADQQLAEIVVTAGSSIEGMTLKFVRFLDRYQLVALALHRAGKAVATLGAGLGDFRLRTGDVLLVQGPRNQIAALKQESELLVLDATSDLPHTAKAPLALTIMMLVVLLAAFGILPIAVSAVCGVFAMIATRCLSWRDATAALSTPVILIVVASLALGLGLLKTGAAEYLAQLVVALTFGAPPVVVLSSLILLMGILTNVVSSNAAAVIGTPIAVSIAQQLDLPTEPFVLAVIFGSNLCYVTPLAHKINVIVMSAGGYNFNDFVRVGAPLLILMWVAYSWVLPMLYPL